MREEPIAELDAIRSYIIDKITHPVTGIGSDDINTTIIYSRTRVYLRIEKGLLCTTVFYSSLSWVGLKSLDIGDPEFFEKLDENIVKISYYNEI